MDREARIKHVSDWLRKKYRVLMGFNAAQGAGVALAVLDFADRRDLKQSLQEEADLAAAFRELKRCLAPFSPATKSLAQRSIVSLTSKALWLCYPEDVPIYDRYALNAVSVLAHILGIRSEQNDEYERYVSVWRQLSDALMASVNKDALPCEAGRAFDRWLLYIAQPSFTSIPSAPRCPQ